MVLAVKKEDAQAVKKPRANKALRAAADECMDLAKVQAAEVVAERIAQVAEGILSAIELSLTKITRHHKRRSRRWRV